MQWRRLVVPLVSPCRMLTRSGSPPSKSLSEEHKCFIACPLFYSIYKLYVSNLPRSNLTHILTEKKLLVTFSVFYPSSWLSPWLVNCLPALLYATSLYHTHMKKRTHTYAHKCFLTLLSFPKSYPGSSPVAAGLCRSYSTCVSGQSLRDSSLAGLFVCWIDGWGAGTWVQEISTSQIRLINPQLILLAEESCWIKNQISPGACR